MSSPVRIVAVNYLNTKPMLAGISTDKVPGLQLALAPPAACAARFLAREADVALLPVAALRHLPKVHVLTGSCIGAHGRVDSVFLVGDRPLAEWTHVLPDPHSRSSNALASVLLARHWQQPVEWLPAPDVGRPAPSGTTGAVLIGDYAMKHRHRYAYVYDLAEDWYAYTQLPFVFAVWAYWPEQLATDTLFALNKALTVSQEAIESASATWAASSGLSQEALLAYYQHSIQYSFGTAQLAAIQRFWSELNQLRGGTSPDLVPLMAQALPQR